MGLEDPGNQIWELVAYLKSMRTPQEPEPPVEPANEMVPDPTSHDRTWVSGCKPRRPNYRRRKWMRRFFYSFRLQRLLLHSQAATRRKPHFEGHGPAAFRIAHLVVVHDDHVSGHRGDYVGPAGMGFRQSTANVWKSTRRSIPKAAKFGLLIGGMAVPFIVLTVLFVLGLNLLSDFPDSWNARTDCP